MPIESAHSKSWLVLGVTSNLLILVYYKYAGFLAANIDAALGLFSLSGFSIWKIALPIGVSFIVFEKLLTLWTYTEESLSQRKIIASICFMSFSFLSYSLGLL